MSPTTTASDHDVIWHTAVCICGLAISVYASIVKYRKHINPKYTAICDLGKYASCTRVLSSPYGRGFGFVGYLLGERHFLNVSNSVAGIAFYSLQLVIAQVPGPLARQVQLGSCVIAGVGSVYLACILAFVLRDLCIVCIMTYVINGFLLYDATWRYVRDGK